MANTISLKQLSASVSSAVQVTLSRHNIKTANGFVINPGTLAGPLLDRATDLAVAQQIAEEVAKQVQVVQAGLPGAAAAAPPEPGLLVTSKYILCGFFPYPYPEINVEKY